METRILFLLGRKRLLLSSTPILSKLSRNLTSMTPPPSPLTGSGSAALIVGAGDSTGSAIARAFSQEGFTICAVRRHKDKLTPLITQINEPTGGQGKAIPFGVDCRKEDQVKALVATIEDTIAPIDLAVFNVGANVNFGITETTSRVYYKVWEMACFAGFLMGREVATRMRSRGRGTIIFTGATASLRGGAGFAAFSGAKFALRSLSQSMARELGPEGIHVAHVVIDGAIDTPWIWENFPGAKELKEVNGLLEPDAIAQNYVNLWKQPKTAWTHELDLRPYIEKW